MTTVDHDMVAISPDYLKLCFKIKGWGTCIDTYALSKREFLEVP